MTQGIGGAGHPISGDMPGPDSYEGCHDGADFGSSAHVPTPTEAAWWRGQAPGSAVLGAGPADHCCLRDAVSHARHLCAARAAPTGTEGRHLCDDTRHVTDVGGHVAPTADPDVRKDLLVAQPEATSLPHGTHRVGSERRCTAGTSRERFTQSRWWYQRLPQRRFCSCGNVLRVINRYPRPHTRRCRADGLSRHNRRWVSNPNVFPVPAAILGWDRARRLAASFASVTGLLCYRTRATHVASKCDGRGMAACTLCALKASDPRGESTWLALEVSGADDKGCTCWVNELLHPGPCR